MHEMMNGEFPAHAVAMCVLVNIFLVLGVAALLKYLIKGGCGCSCCCKKQASCDSNDKGCCN